MVTTRAVDPKRLKVILPQPVRYFTRNGCQLSHTGRCFGKGAIIMLGPIEQLRFVNLTKDATPFTIDDGKEYYFLVDEIPIVGIREKLMELAVITP